MTVCNATIEVGSTRLPCQWGEAGHLLPHINRDDTPAREWTFQWVDGMVGSRPHRSDDVADRVYLALKGARERLCIAQQALVEHRDKMRLGAAIDFIDLTREKFDADDLRLRHRD